MRVVEDNDACASDVGCPGGERWWVVEIVVVVVAVAVEAEMVVVVVVVVHPLNKSISPRPNARPMHALFNSAHSEYKFRTTMKNTAAVSVYS